MLAVGWFSSASNADGDKRANGCACAHEHTVSRPDVDQHAGACAYEFTHCHFDTDFGAVGNGYTNPDGHTFSNTGANRDECSNSHINSRDVGDIVAYTYADGTTHGCPDRHAHTDSHSYRGPHIESHSAK